MNSFAERCGIHDAARQAAVAQCIELIRTRALKQVRFVWCDLHGVTRGKTLMAHAALKALNEGVGMVSTLLLKDTSDHTAYNVFEPGGMADLPKFEHASNLLLLADPGTFKVLPWSADTGWVQCQPWFQDGQPVELDTRRALQTALTRLARHGFGMCCGLEVEFHVYRIEHTTSQLDPELAAWPGLPPHVSMIHPGYNLLNEAWFDMAEEPLNIVRDTAQALGLPLQSLEIELGPSQVEAVFDATDVLTAADSMVLFRNGVRQALLRAGYWATFMCRPPFAHIMSSGWHLHQSLVRLSPFSANAFVRDHPLTGSTPADAEHTLSATGAHYLAGLLAHAPGMTALCTPTANGFGRFRANALAPQAVLWGKDNRGAMLRVVGDCGNTATRIENRLGEPAANPYLYMASQIYAGLDGITCQRLAPPATEAPYAAASSARLPTDLGQALAALQADPLFASQFSKTFIDYFCRVKQSEFDRFTAADDKDDFQRREYFSRY